MEGISFFLMPILPNYRQIRFYKGFLSSSNISSKYTRGNLIKKSIKILVGILEKGVFNRSKTVKH